MLTNTYKIEDLSLFLHGQYIMLWFISYCEETEKHTIRAYQHPFQNCNKHLPFVKPAESKH